VLIVLINRLLESQLGKRIQTIIFDEAHEYLGGHRIREHDPLLEKLGKVTVQKVFITGTLPTRMETLFLEKVYLKHDPPTHIIIRSPTFRPELAHHVVEIPSNMPSSVSCIDFTANLTNSLRTHIRPNERFIIFVQSVPDAEALSLKLNCSKFYSSLGDNGSDEKTLNLNAWTNGQSIIMVATPAFIHGIDHPSIRFVIFHGGAYGLISYYQGAGRGGRRGDRCDVFTVRDKREKKFKHKEDIQDVEASEEWKKFETTTQCRLSVITGCLDGTSLNCHKIPNQQPCDNCHPKDLFHVLALNVIKYCWDQGQNPHSKLNLASSSSFHSPIKRQRSDNPTSSSSVLPSPMKRPRLDKPLSSSNKYRVSSEEMKNVMVKFQISSSRPDSSPVNSSSITSSSVTSSSITSSPINSFPVVNSSPIYSYSSSVNSSPGMPGILGQRHIGGDISRGASKNSWPDEQKRNKSDLLNKIMPTFQDICPLCFILKGERVQSLPVGQREGSGHQPFHNCELNVKFTDYVQFSKGITLGGPYLYCFACGMPQGKGGNSLEPKCHKDVSSSSNFWSGKNGPACPWKDMIRASLFALYYDETAMKDLLIRFKYTKKDDCREMTLDEWAKWLGADFTEGEYWKGLEVFLYWMAERGLK
jgi:hypothetical protein